MSQKPETIAHYNVLEKIGSGGMGEVYLAAAIRSINQPPLTLRWTPDGKALAYVRDENEVSNIWTIPLDGGKPRQITSFNENYIAYFDWSPDGKQLVVSRGSISSDAVLIRNGK